MPPKARWSDVHPAWISKFPGGVYIHDDGTPDPEEEEEPEGGVRTFVYRNGQMIETGTYLQKDWRDALTDLGY